MNTSLGRKHTIPVCGRHLGFLQGRWKRGCLETSLSSLIYNYISKNKNKLAEIIFETLSAFEYCTTKENHVQHMLPVLIMDCN